MYHLKKLFLFWLSRPVFRLFYPLIFLFFSSNFLTTFIFLFFVTLFSSSFLELIVALFPWLSSSTMFFFSSSTYVLHFSFSPFSFDVDPPPFYLFNLFFISYFLCFSLQNLPAIGKPWEFINPWAGYRIIEGSYFHWLLGEKQYHLYTRRIGTNGPLVSNCSMNAVLGSNLASRVLRGRQGVM